MKQRDTLFLFVKNRKKVEKERHKTDFVEYHAVYPMKQGMIVLKGELQVGTNGFG